MDDEHLVSDDRTAVGWRHPAPAHDSRVRILRPCSLDRRHELGAPGQVVGEVRGSDEALTLQPDAAEGVPTGWPAVEQLVERKVFEGRLATLEEQLAAALLAHDPLGLGR